MERKSEGFGRNFTREIDGSAIVERESNIFVGDEESLFHLEYQTPNKR